MNKLLDGAVLAALAAGEVIRKHYVRPLRIREKGNLGLVTNADVEAEKTAIKILKKTEPRFGWLTEETHAEGTMKQGQKGLWILDPLDGTTNFIHRFPMFCVTIAAWFEDQTQIAVTYHPILDEPYTAVLGQGAFLTTQASCSKQRQKKIKLKISKTAKLSDALLTTGFAYRYRNLFNTEISSFKQIAKIARAVRRPGSAALDLAYTARGVFDGFWERHLSPWDVAAGALLVQEAGGKATAFDGTPFSPFSDEVLASNGKVHRELVKIMTLS